MKNKITLAIGILMLSGFVTKAAADLKIDIIYLVSTITITNSTFSQSDCDVQEGCTQAGQRKLLKFGLRQVNVGDDDFDLGKVDEKPYFTYDACHDHNHFDGFGKMELYDFNCTQVLVGGKLGGCMYNYDPVGHPNAIHCGKLRFRNCDKKQGISSGCADVYNTSLPCQYIDITGIPDGRYFLKVTINFDQTLIQAHSNLQESDYTNNTAYVLCDIVGNSVTVRHGTHTIPNNLVKENIDNLPPPFNELRKFLIARNTIEIGPGVEIKDDKNREIFAGSSITLYPGTDINAEEGGIIDLYINPCLSVASFKMSNNEGLFSNMDNVPIAPLGNNHMPMLYEDGAHAEAVEENEEDTKTLPDNIDSYEGYTLNNYPNPFNDGTIIAAYLPGEFFNPEVVIHDVVGNVIQRVQLKPGHNFVEIKPDDFNYGIYFYSLMSDGTRIETKKMVYVK